MRYLALACDYDGTLAHHGKVDEPTLAALKRLLATGRQLILVSGRELDDLQATFDHLELFDLAVLENGALLYRPGTKQQTRLSEPPSEKFVAALRRRGVPEISVGESIVAFWRPHEAEALEAIQECGLELQIIFNKDAVMVLPAGVNKATGLAAALDELGLSPHNVVGVGDAENDHAFLTLCECGVAVDNALPAVKETADWVTRGDHGRGVVELIDEVVKDDLSGREGRLKRHHLLLGHRADRGEREVRLPPHGTTVLIAGPSGSGKSTTATSLLERLVDNGYQFCLIDPEGDYSAFEGATTVGSPTHAPTADEVLERLRSPKDNAVVSLVGMSVTERPGLFLSLLPRLQEMRAKVGRPHWVVLDEAHHLLPASWERADPALAPGLDNALLITVHPDQVHPAALRGVNVLVAVGQGPEKVVKELCRAVEAKAPPLRGVDVGEGEVLFWGRAGREGPFGLRVVPHRGERHRHVRKYAEGSLPPERSFYFRGPEKKLNLRAHNLMLFVQMADGVDEETWGYHLREGDYARWFRDCIKDAELAAEAERVAGLGVGAKESLALIRQAVEKRYTLPAAPALPMPGTDAEQGRA